MLALKQMLVERRLCNAFSGGLSSFSLSLLVLRYLQHVRQFPEQAAAWSASTKSLLKHVQPQRGNDAAPPLSSTPGRFATESIRWQLSEWPGSAPDVSPRPYSYVAAPAPALEPPSPARTPPPSQPPSPSAAGPLGLRPGLAAASARAPGATVFVQAAAPPALGALDAPPSSTSVAGRPRAAAFAKRQFEAYHRQLADWPSADAAHHYEWMRAIVSPPRNEALSGATPSVVFAAAAQGQRHTPTMGSGSSSNSSDSSSRSSHSNRGTSNTTAAATTDSNASSEPGTASDGDSVSASQGDCSVAGLELDTIGERLLGFLDFYGNQFRPDELGITVIGQGAFYRMDKSTFSRPPQPITIDNPRWPNLNVAASSYAISQVLQTCRSLHETLLRELATSSAAEPEPAVLRKVLKLKWVVFRARAKPAPRAVR
jgi:hypothetical protein